MNIKILKHEKTKSSYFYKHKALVEMEELDIKKFKQEILFNVSIEVGYHPLGYGLYGGSVSKSSKEGQYIIVWETGTSCD